MYQYGMNDVPQIQNQLQQMLLTQNNQSPMHTVKVNGRAGADSFNMPPNSDTILLDMNDPIAWFVMTDGAGYKTVTPYDLSPHKEVKQEDVLKSMEDRIARLEEVVRNGKSNFTANYAKSAKSDQQRNDAGGRGNAQG